MPSFTPFSPKHTSSTKQPPQRTRPKLRILVSLTKAASSAFTSTTLRRYEVFLSFRGEDTRASFTSHLHTSLRNSGITTFVDDDSLERGDHIKTSLLRSIEQSRISVVIFSRNYADSRWCLGELKKIMECQRTIGQVVLPVFYDVDPSEVRHQTGEFGKAFQNLLNRMLGEEEEKRNWREALREAAGLAGFVVINSKNESEAIKNIVEKVTHLLDKTDLFVCDNPVGVESRVQDIIQQLDIQQSNDVLLLGMWGMGGIGKTTIAKAIYNTIGHNFEGRSFLANIREAWEQTARQVDLQEQLLFDIFKETTTKIQSIELGKILLKHRLCHKRVLLVLDDVDKLDQLNTLCGSRRWFGRGSRIIITTRDMHILKGNRVDKRYPMEEMDERESIELFSWHAFKQESPREDFAELSKSIVEYCGGLPLALEVLGSYLFDRGVTEWKCVLEKLKIIPNDQVHKKLKISYDGLDDDTEKELFLDIACFLIGMDQNDAIHILNGCGLFAEIGISVLVERSLVTVDGKNKLGMHDLLRDMGREIIREKSPKELEEQSRLWFHEDVIDLLSQQTGTKAVEGLALKVPRANAKCFSTKAFMEMKRLRLLQLDGVQLDGDFEQLSRNIRWLCWNGFPLSCIPPNFYQGNLVSLELENSNVKLVWKKTQTTSAMSSLVLLDVPNSSSHELPSMSECLPRLRSLWLECGSELQLSRDAAIILDVLCSTNSKELESTATTSQVSNTEASASIQCCSKGHISGSKDSLKSLLIQMGTNCQVTNILRENFLQNMTINGCGGCLLPYPDWLTFNCESSSVKFEVPQVEGRNLKTIMCIVHSSSPDDIISDGLKNVLVINHTKATIQLYKGEALASFGNEEWQRVASSIEPGNMVEVVVVFENGFIVKETTIYLIYNEPIGEEIEQYHAPDEIVIDCNGHENNEPIGEEIEQNHAPDENVIDCSSHENNEPIGKEIEQNHAPDENVFDCSGHENNEPIGEEIEQYHAPKKNVIDCSGNENECTVRRISPQPEPIDDLNRNRENKFRVTWKTVKKWLCMN